MVPRDRSSRLVETRRYPIVVVGSVYSCWVSSSRLQITLTGPSICLAILTARRVPYVGPCKCNIQAGAALDRAGSLRRDTEAISRLQGTLVTILLPAIDFRIFLEVPHRPSPRGLKPFSGKGRMSEMGHFRK